MKYSTAAFTFALALLAANNDVADAGEFNLRGRDAANRRRARHLKNRDTTGDDALAADNRATPKVADDMITEDAAVVEEESIKSETEPSEPKKGEDDVETTEGADAEKDSIKSEQVPKAKGGDDVETTVDADNMAATVVEEKAAKAHKGAMEKMEEEVEAVVTEIENMAETAVEVMTGKKEKASSQSSDEEEEVEEPAVVDGVEGEGKGKGKGNIDDAAAEVRADGDEDSTNADGLSTETTEESKGKGKKGSDAIEEAAEDDENETMLVRAEIEGDMSVPCSGKGCPKSPKSDDETTDEIEARTDADETTEDEIVSIKSCKGKHCKKNTTSIEEDGVEEKKHGKGKKIDEDELGDAEVRAEGAAADTPVAEVKVKKCKGKKCEQDVQEIANLAEAGVAEAVAVATEEPSKVSKISSDETEVRTEGATDIAEVKGKKHQEEIANLAEAGVAEAVAMATEEPSKVSKISSDETEDSTEAIVADAGDIAEAVTVGKGKKHGDDVEGDEVGAAEESKPKKEKSHAAALVIGDSESMPEQIAREDDTR